MLQISGQTVSQLYTYVKQCFFMHVSFLSAEKLSEERSVSGPGTRQRQRPHPISVSWDDTTG